VTAPVVLAAVVAPAAFWVAYLYHHDRRQPEPLAAVALSYLLGLGAGWACLWVFDLIPPAPGDRLRFAAYAVGVVGGLEELAKLLPFVLVCRRLAVFDEELDGVVYASAVALGFATVENVLYLEELSGAALYARAVASPLVHTIFASFWGVLIARAKLAGRPILLPAVAGLAIAALVHGAYDFLATDAVAQPGAAAVILLAWLWRLRVKRRLHQEGVFPIPRRAGLG
jgi:RsiW-degrading membrane proteinase PrsW (M82 family)